MSANKKEEQCNIDPFKKCITIIQLTRFGDLIQTSVVARSLKAQYPEYKLVLVARKQFAEPLSFILKKHFDSILLLDWNHLLSETKSKSLSELKNNLKGFVSKINAEASNVVINLSFSKTSNYLLSLINSQHKIGPYYDDNNVLKIDDKWSQMLYSTVLRGPLNPFSLIDLYSNIIGITKRKIPTPKINTTDRKTIIIHPFTSSERKRWKPIKWVETIYKVLAENQNVKVKIVGSKDDSKDAMAIFANPLLHKFLDRVENLVGKTSLEELYNLLDERCLFVGHDSMVGHMASLKSVQTLTVSLGNVRAFETTPYGVSNYNIAPKTKCYPCFPDDKCNYYQCHIDIPYQAVVSSISCLLQTGEITNENIEKHCSSFFLTPIKIYRSHKSDIDFMQLEDILGSNASTSDLYRAFYRISWLYLFNEVEEKQDYPKIQGEGAHALKFNINGLQHIYELAEFGKKYSRYILEEVASESPRLEKIRDYSKKIDEIDHLSNLTCETYPVLSPIVDYSKLAKSNMFGENLVQLTESSFLIYDQISFLASTVFELSKKTIDEDMINNNKEKQSSKRGI